MYHKLKYKPESIKLLGTIKALEKSLGPRTRPFKLDTKSTNHKEKQLIKYASELNMFVL